MVNLNTASSLFIVFQTLIILMFSCNSNTENNSQDTILLNSLKKSLTLNNSFLKEANQFSYLIIRDQLEDLSRMRYKPILFVADTVRGYTNKLLLETEKIEKALLDTNHKFESNSKNIDSYIELVSSYEAKIKIHFENFIKSNGVNFGLKSDEIEKYYKYIASNIKIEPELIGAFKNDTKVPPIVFEILRQKILHSEYIALTQLQITTGSRISFDYTYYPIIMTEKPCIKKGEYFDAKIGIGLYLTPRVLPENMEIFVNNKSMNIDEFGTVNFSEQGNKVGENKLVVKFDINESDTTFSHSGQATYFYNVVQ